MEHVVQSGTEQAAGLQWVKAFMAAWDSIDTVPEDVDTHAVAALACRLYPCNMDLDVRAVARREWEKDGGVSCYGVLS